LDWAPAFSFRSQIMRRVLTVSLALSVAVLVSCSDGTPPTAPNRGPSSERTGKLEEIPNLDGLIIALFSSTHEQSALSMWAAIQRDKPFSAQLLSHLNNITKFTLDELGLGTIVDPDGDGPLNATSGVIFFLGEVYRYAEMTPTKVPDPPPGFDAAFVLIDPALITEQQEILTSGNDIKAIVKKNSFNKKVMLVVVKQNDENLVNTPFPKLSNTVDIGVAPAENPAPGEPVTLLLCPKVTASHDAYDRGVVAHQKSATEVVYLDRTSGANFCGETVGFNWRQEKGFLKRRGLQLASYASKAWNLVAPKPLYAGHAAIGGLFDSEGGFSPAVLIDPLVYTKLTIDDIDTPPIIYGQPVPVRATLVVDPDDTRNPEVFRGMPVQQLTILASIDAPAATEALTNNDGVATWSFSNINAGSHSANVRFPQTSDPLNAPLYGAISGSQDFTVQPKPITVTADDQERFYGDPNATPTGNVTETAYDEVITGVFTHTAVLASDVGPYPILADVTYGEGVLASNYALTKVDGVLTINRAPLQIAAGTFTREYGLANPSFQPGTVTGAKLGQVIGLDFTTAATILSDVGTYDIVPSLATEQPNYEVTGVTNGSLNITPAPLTVQAGDATRVYGDTNPTFSATFVAPNVPRNGDEATLTFSFATPANTLTGVGGYPITGGIQGVKATNYSLTSLPGTLTITTRELTGSIADKSKVEGELNPLLTGSVTNTVAGDGFVPTFFTTPAEPVAVGNYPITLNLSVPGGSNYTWAGTNGNLFVTAASGLDGLVADQVFDLASGTSNSCPGGIGSIFQSFTPTAVNLAAVQLRTRDGGSFPAEGYSSTIRIRQGSPTGEVLATVTTQLSGAGGQRLVTYALESPIALTPGSVYVIEMVDVEASILSWIGTSEGNPYAGGNAFGCSPGAVSIADQDRNFKTFYLPAS
jgi:hypothetical protein